jgi:polar amino acid transport system permease protein
MRRALPGCGNEIIYLIKYSSLAYMVTCIELTGKAKILASASFKYIEVFMIVGVIYLFLVTLASSLLSRLEKGWGRCFL